MLTKYKTYTRQQVHDELSPDTRFVAQTGTWGLHGVVRIANKPGDWVFFVTYGKRQAHHAFRESITSDGVLSWQSQPRQTLGDAAIREWIDHDEQTHNIHLFLRTRPSHPYFYLGLLAYEDHDPERDQPVFFRWRILDWNPPDWLRTQVEISPTTADRDGGHREKKPPTMKKALPMTAAPLVTEPPPVRSATPDPRPRSPFGPWTLATILIRQLTRFTYCARSLAVVNRSSTDTPDVSSNRWASRPSEMSAQDPSVPTQKPPPSPPLSTRPNPAADSPMRSGLVSDATNAEEASYALTDTGIDPVATSRPLEFTGPGPPVQPDPQPQPLLDRGELGKDVMVTGLQDSTNVSTETVDGAGQDLSDDTVDGPPAPRGDNVVGLAGTSYHPYEGNPGVVGLPTGPSPDVMDTSDDNGTGQPDHVPAFGGKKGDSSPKDEEGPSLDKKRPPWPPDSEEKRRIHPSKRGGGVRGKRPRVRTPGSPLGAMPLLVCVRQGYSWRLLIESLSGDTPRQRDQPLPSLRDGYWALKDLSPVTIGNMVHSMGSSHGPMIFRLQRDETGTLVAAPSGQGRYLFVMPHGWHMSQGDLQPLQLDGHDAYLVDELQAARVTNGDGKIVWKGAGHAWVGFKGSLAPCVEPPTPLFYGDAPEVDAPWDKVTTLVVGQEGHVRDRWRQTVTIDAGREPRLPTLPNPVGWYFTRFYDSNAVLVESRDFLWIRDVEHIAVSLLKSGEGVITFRHKAHLKVDCLSELVHCERTPTSTVAHVPCGPRVDVTRWSFRDSSTNNELHDVPFRIPRWTWALSANGEPDESLTWGAEPLSIRAKADISPTSRSVLLFACSELGDARTSSLLLECRGQRWSLPVTKGRATFSLSQLTAVFDEDRRSMVPDTVITASGRLVGHVRRSFRCSRCGIPLGHDYDQALTHVATEHRITDQRPSNYDQYIRLAQKIDLRADLPTTIYKCTRCDFIVPAMALTSPNSVITSHFEAEHKDNAGRAQVKFTVLHKVDDVRKYFDQTLPDIFQCSECREPFRPAADAAWTAHRDAHHADMVAED